MLSGKEFMRAYRDECFINLSADGTPGFPERSSLTDLMPLLDTQRVALSTVGMSRKKLQVSPSIIMY